MQANLWTNQKELEIWVMAKRQFTLNEREVAMIRQREATTNDGREVKRLQAVRLYGSARRWRPSST